jgi:hypothetical protein
MNLQVLSVHPQLRVPKSPPWLMFADSGTESAPQTEQEPHDKDS